MVYLGWFFFFRPRVGPCSLVSSLFFFLCVCVGGSVWEGGWGEAGSSLLTAKALRLAFFSSVSVRVRNTPKLFLGFMSGLYQFYK